MNEDARPMWKWLGGLIAIAGCMFAVGLAVRPVLVVDHHNGGGMKCISKLHQIGLALLMYVQDDGGVLPSSAIVSHSSRWSRRGCSTFCTKLSGHERDASGMPLSYARALYPYYIKSSRLFFCKDDPARTQDEDSTVSYWWKCAIDKAWFGEGCAEPRRRIADYPRPHSTIVIYENMARHHAPLGPLRDGSRIPLLCMDGSASYVTLSNTTSGDPVNCAANSDGEPMYFNYDNRTKTRCAGPATYVDPARYSDDLSGLSD